jgi:hypothetical protein
MLSGLGLGRVPALAAGRRVIQGAPAAAVARNDGTEQEGNVTGHGVPRAVLKARSRRAELGASGPSDSDRDGDSESPSHGPSLRRPAFRVSAHWHGSLSQVACPNRPQAS